MKTTQVEQVPSLWWQTIWENFSMELSSLDSVTESITQVEQSPMIGQQVVWWNYSAQMTEKQNSVEICIKSLRKETLPIYGNCCSFDPKKKSCPYETTMNWLQACFGSKLVLWKIIL